MSEVVNGQNVQGTPAPQDGQQGQAVNPQQPVAQPQNVVVTSQQQPKEGLLQKAKKHWKGAVATVVAIGAAVTTGIVAHRKGVQAGMMMNLQPEENDDGSYSPLDPNV